MLKATVKLSGGRTVTIEGPPEEVRALLEHYEGGESLPATRPKKSKAPSARRPGTTVAQSRLTPQQIAEIANEIRTCAEAEGIESNILDKPSEPNRVLLPLYVIHQYLDDKYSLTTTEISKITAELKTRVSRQNALRGIDKAAKYVQPDKARQEGIPTRYTLNRRGIQYMKAVIAGTSDAEGV